jgi:hypothetical protein
VQVLSDFQAQIGGAKEVNYASDPVTEVNEIKLAPQIQAAVSFGAGVSTQELNDALDISGLVAMGAADGKSQTFPFLSSRVLIRIQTGAVSVAGGWVRLDRSLRYLCKLTTESGTRWRPRAVDKHIWTWC